MTIFENSVSYFIFTVFTFSHSVVDDIVIDVKPLGPRDANGWREAIMKSTALNVSFPRRNLV